MSRRSERVTEEGGHAFRDSAVGPGPANNATAIAIVVAGALIAGGILASVLLRAPEGGAGSGRGQQSAPPASNTVETPGFQSSAAATGGSATPSGDTGAIDPRDTLHLHIPYCAPGNPTGGHVDDFTVWERTGSPLARQITSIAEAGQMQSGDIGTTHACTVPIEPGLNVYLTYHKFHSTDAMNDTFEDVFRPYTGISSGCETGGVLTAYGDYGPLPDGRTGKAVCNLQRDALVFFSWTEETTNVISLVYGTDASQTTMDAMRAFWLERAGPICRTTQEGPQVALSQCEDH